jgi:hypothetical protein
MNGPGLRKVMKEFRNGVYVDLFQKNCLLKSTGFTWDLLARGRPFPLLAQPSTQEIDECGLPRQLN